MAVRNRIPPLPSWLPPLAIGLAGVILLNHLTWLLFLPVVLLAVWETAHNFQLALDALLVSGPPVKPIGRLAVVVAVVLGLALLVSGWVLLTLVYAASWAARWRAAGRRL